MPLMVYMTTPLLKTLRNYSKAHRLSASEVVRQGVLMRINEDDPYNKGFDDGLDCAIKAAENTTAGAMRFPNGKSFADCIKEELDSHRRAND
jgi:hypothetical protein